MSMVIYGDESTFEDEEGDSLEIKKIKNLIREQEKNVDREIREIFSKTMNKNYEDIHYIDEEGYFHLTEYGINLFKEVSEIISIFSE